MKKEDLYNAPKYAGIYYFRNKINNKYYIGQSIKIRKRVLHHLSNYKTERYNNAIYRAFKKYGFENFEFGILNTFRNALSKETKEKLDELEKYYIQKYNSYGQTGYNETLGGDAGILGYKMTEDQLEKISKASKLNNTTAKKIYMYNLKDKYYITACSIRDASKITGIYYSNISRLVNKKYIKNTVKYFLCSFLKEDLENQKNSLTKEEIEYIISNENIGRFKKGHNYSSKNADIKSNKRKLSKSHKENISESLKKYKRIEVYNKDMSLCKTFRYKEEASDYIGCKVSSLRSACTGYRKTCKGYIIKEIK